ncbi:MAG: hypothetical protein LUH19_04470 [Lachnospiraceae bacterium]|nr:hypothetical protein [Lachnospiraceae bacterium]
MRSLNRKVKIIFAAFSVCVVAALASFVVAAVVVANAQTREYTLSSGTVTYDNVYTQITLDQQGTVSASSDGGYQLAVGETVYSLGDATVAALPGNTSLEVFGGQYVFDTDGTVTTMSSHYTFEDLTATRLGKISDTKYVIVGDSIETEDGQLNVNGYLYVVLDSAGNARVINGGTNVKLLSGSVIKAGNLVWNLEDGTIDMGDYTIDLETLGNYSFTSGQTYSYTIQGGNGGSG